MKTTPEKLIRLLTEWVETGGIRKDEPLYVLIFSRVDLNVIAQWHGELSRFPSELRKLTDEDIEKVFDRTDGSEVQDKLLSSIGDFATDQCRAFREKSDRYKLYFELQKEFNTVNPALELPI